MVETATRLMVVAVLFRVSDGMQTAELASHRCENPLLLSFLANSMVGLPVGYLPEFPKENGIIGIWTGFLFGLSFASTSFHFRNRQIDMRANLEANPRNA